MNTYEYSCNAHTLIWTGDADRKGVRLIATGLLGSIRWWFEVVVRGLGGKACDPTVEDNRCPDAGKKRSGEDGHHCVVCELFGCTGWARKFRFDVLDANGKHKQDQIKNGDTFKLRFTELRPIAREEWALLDLTLRLIAEYGAIGGKTVYKPSDEPNRQNAHHHHDYGLTQICQRPQVLLNTEDELKHYVIQPRWRKVSHSYRDNQGCVNDFSWASLNNFWCVKGQYLARQDQKQSSFNTVLGRKPDKSERERRGNRIIRWSDLLENPKDKVAQWLAGRQQESKKVFSFKSPPRTFGFVKPDLITFDDMKQRLRGAWPNLRDEEFLTGATILDELLKNRSQS
ncbi:MAG TPA: type III-B CRISPR module RAMP protein Cmr1 [Nitrososphaera sp.]|nr:type III-B CRISPR module RAMP protein Cmr1 [Nitrososphaera sp.]